MAQSKQRPTTKPLFYLGIALVAWLLIPFGWKIAVKSTFDEFHAPIWESSSRVRDLSHYWGHISDSKNTLIEKGRDHARIMSDIKLQLGSENDLQKKLDKLRTIKREIAMLEKSLNLQPSLNFYPEIARVSHRSLSAWSQILEVNKGINYNINEGAGVISSIGVIGRIDKVASSSASIQLITNQEFRIVAHLKGDERPITFTGAGISLGRKNFGLISDVPQDVTIPQNNSLDVVSSSLSGTFPKGIKIGHIEKLEPSIDGLFQSAEVILSDNLNLIEEVTILNKFDE